MIRAAPALIGTENLGFAIRRCDMLAYDSLLSLLGGFGDCDNIGFDFTYSVFLGLKSAKLLPYGYFFRCVCYYPKFANYAVL